MDRRDLLTSSVAALVLPRLYGEAGAPMSDAEREQAVQLMKDSRKEFFALLEPLTDEQWKWKPLPTRWSAGEVAEHIVLAEGSLFAKVQEALANPPNPDWETKTAGKTDLLLRVMAPRLGKAQAPEDIQPQGKLARAGVMAQFTEARARSLKFAEETQASLKDHTAEHPFAFFNTLNAYQWLIYIPLHNQRHDKQIQEVIATAGFPHP